MDHFAGLDVSVKETSVCIVDDTGRIVREVKVASEPDALLAVLGNPAYLCLLESNSRVSVMEPAQDGTTKNVSGPLNGARHRRVLI